MKLYDLDHSPFAARVRMAVYAKGLRMEFLPPPGGVRSAAFRAINPLGLVPALALEGGAVIAESEVIVEYLEDRFPDPPLRPDTPEERARARLLARIVDLLLAEPLKRLFDVAKGTAPADGAAPLREAVGQALAAIDGALAGGSHAVGGRLSTADCALAPLLFFVDLSAPLFPIPPFASHARLRAYWKGIAAEPAAARVLAELAAAQTRRATARARGLPED